MAVWREDGSAFPSFESFLQRFREVFDHPKEGKSAGEWLLVLSQDKKTAAEYALTFHTLAAQTNWVEDTLKVLFRKGLSHGLQSELACKDEGRNLDQFIELAIKLDNLIRSRRSSVRQSPRLPLSASPKHVEPMEISTCHLSAEERDCRLSQHLCPVLWATWSHPSLMPQ